jgi:hypothetical protein
MRSIILIDRVEIKQTLEKQTHSEILLIVIRIKQRTGYFNLKQGNFSMFQIETCGPSGFKSIFFQTPPQSRATHTHIPGH